MDKIDEQTIAKLDEDFRNCLKFIRPYIISLTNPNYITLCRVWFEKLNSCSVEEKAVRNDHLNELYRQIQNGKLEEPFISMPPDGSLLENAIHFSSNSWSDMSTLSTTTEIAASGDGESNSDPTTKEKSEICSDMYDGKFNEQNLLIEELKHKNDLLTERLNKCMTQLNARNTKAELGINMLAGEVEYLKTRLKELIAMKRNLQTSHNGIVLQWENVVQNLQVKLSAGENLNKDLQSKIVDLETKLEAAKNGQDCDHGDYEEEIKMLNKENYEQAKYLEDMYKKKVHELENMCHTQQDNLRKEIEHLNEKHDTNVTSLQETHTKKLIELEKDFDEKIMNLVKEFEGKVGEIQAENDKNMKCKDEEVIRLEKLVDEQCDRMHQEVVYIKSQIESDIPSSNKDTLVEKVTFLQKCILKMERLLRKYEKYYTKKINVLRKELLIKDNAVQIQLTTQRAQLMSRASTERQVEIEDVVSQLERRYRTLLEDQQAQANCTRQQHLNMIKQLTDKLEART